VRRRPTVTSSTFCLALLCIALFGGASAAGAVANLLPVTRRVEVDLTCGAVRETYSSLGIGLLGAPVQFRHLPIAQLNAAEHRSDWRLCIEYPYKSTAAALPERATDLQYADRLLHEMLPSVLDPRTNPWRGPAAGYAEDARHELVRRTLQVLRDTGDTDCALAYLCDTNRRLAGLRRAATADDLG
jgi:hypothetical protein